MAISIFPSNLIISKSFMDIGIGRYKYPMGASSPNFEVGYALGTGKNTKKLNFLTTEKNKNKKGGKQII